MARVDTSLLFCITGSVAAPAVLPVLQILVERDVFRSVKVALSRSALRFVREEPFAVMSQQRCITDLFAEAAEGRAAHVAAMRECGLALVAPASANTMAKLACGIADETVTIALSVFEGPRILVPAAHPSTRAQKSYARNESILREDGFLFCGPVEGYSISENRRGPEVAGIPRAEVIAAFVEYVALEGVAPDENAGWNNE